MARKTHTVAEIQDLELLAEEIVGFLREIRVGMVSEKISEFECQLATAKIHLEWLQKWGARTLADFRVFKGRVNARKQAESHAKGDTKT